MNQDLMKLSYPEDVTGMSPWENPKDPYGRGASPRTALLFEALANAISAYGGITDRIPTSDLIRKGMYAMDPKFLGEDYSGSGSSFPGGPLRGMIGISNTTRSWQDMLREILQHENIHRNTGSMGGVPRFSPENSKYEQFLMALDEMDRNPQERMAYMLDRRPMLRRTYYNKGDMQKAIPQYLSDWKYANKE